MKQCPKCGKAYKDEAGVCLVDGATLISSSGGLNKNKDPLIDLTIDGKYKLEKRIGQGGMGAVYIASHTKFDKKAAVKVLSRDLMAQEPTSYERFRREAEASARIKHPNAVSVTDFGQTEDGIIYLVMEYVDGVSVRRLLDGEKKLAPQRVVDLGRQICAAIAAAHRAGIVHRDLKPDNVMIEIIDGKETARVLDFGIAKLKDSQQRRITETGNVLGTPHYMSPEQCKGETTDHRSDIYALGVTLYEMLSGKLPFDAPTAPAVIVQKVIQAPTPLNEVCPEVPEPIARVVMRALEKRPDRRQQTAADLADQLEAALVMSGTVQEDRREKVMPNSWRVVFHGAIDDSPEIRRRLIEGLKRGFSLSAERAEALLKSGRSVVKKNVSQEEALKVAERLRSIGADVKVEHVLEAESPKAPLTVANADTVKMDSESNESTGRDRLKTSEIVQTRKMHDSPGRQPSEAALTLPSPEKIGNSKANSLNSTESQIDPLLVTDGAEMLTYITEQAKLSASTKAASIEPGTGQLSNPSDLSRPTSELASAGLTKIMQTPSDWTIDIKGMFYENMSDQDVEALIRSSRVRPNHKARKGMGNWYELGTVPHFRKIFKDINPHIFDPQAEVETMLKKEEEERGGSRFLSRMLKLLTALVVVYSLSSLGLQYMQQRMLEDDLRVILSDSNTTIATLRDRARFAVRQRKLTVPDSNIRITADPPNKRVSVLIDYSRTLFGITLNYQARKEASNFNLPIEQLVEAPDGDIEIIGIPREEIMRYRQDQALKNAAEKLADYEGEPETVKERDKIKSELREFEKNLPLFDILSEDEQGRQSYSKVVKIRNKEYSKEAAQSHVNELESQLTDVERLLAEQREKKIKAEIKNNGNK